MRVGLSMLTFVPGAMGGSETYARALARALATRGALEVTAFVPSLAPDLGDGLPTEVVEEYRSAASTAGRLRAMASAAAFPGALRLRFQGIDVVHYPFTTSSISTCRRCSRARSGLFGSLHTTERPAGRTS